MKTKDGVQINDGMTVYKAVYYSTPGHNWPPTQKGVNVYSYIVVIKTTIFYESPSELYSTKAAAIAAKEKEQRCLNIC